MLPVPTTPARNDEGAEWSATSEAKDAFGNHGSENKKELRRIAATAAETGPSSVFPAVLRDYPKPAQTANTPGRRA